jgi:hypothetical protein
MLSNINEDGDLDHGIRAPTEANGQACERDPMLRRLVMSGLILLHLCTLCHKLS